MNGSTQHMISGGDGRFLLRIAPTPAQIEAGDLLSDLTDTVTHVALAGSVSRSSSGGGIRQLIHQVHTLHPLKSEMDFVCEEDFTEHLQRYCLIQSTDSTLRHVATLVAEIWASGISAMGRSKPPMAFMRAARAMNRKCPPLRVKDLSRCLNDCRSTLRGEYPFSMKGSHAVGRTFCSEYVVSVYQCSRILIDAYDRKHGGAARAKAILEEDLAGVLCGRTEQIGTSSLFNDNEVNRRWVRDRLRLHGLDVSGSLTSPLGVLYFFMQQSPIIPSGLGIPPMREKSNSVNLRRRVFLCALRRFAGLRAQREMRWSLASEAGRQCKMMDSPGKNGTP